MKLYIFITNEGFTFQPDSELSEPDIDNCQVIGFGKGKNIEDALKDMLLSQEYLLETSFDQIIGLELRNNERKCFSLNDYKKLLMKILE